MKIRRQNVPAKIGERIALGIILVTHVLAICIFLPPRELLSQDPIFADDHPVHAHRIHLYRPAFFESRYPWGYDRKYQRE